MVEHMDVILVKHAFGADMIHFSIFYGDGVHGVPLVPDAHLLWPVDVPKEVDRAPEGVEGALHFGEIFGFEGLADVCAHLIVCLEDGVLDAFVPVPTLARAAFLFLVLGEEGDAVAEKAPVDPALLFDVVVFESSLSIFFQVVAPVLVVLGASDCFLFFGERFVLAFGFGDGGVGWCSEFSGYRGVHRHGVEI